MPKKPAEKVIHKAMRSIDKIYTETPGNIFVNEKKNISLSYSCIDFFLFSAFADIFDEETWYQFCFVFVCSTIVCVFILARWVYRIFIIENTSWW